MASESIPYPPVLIKGVHPDLWADLRRHLDENGLESRDVILYAHIVATNSHILAAVDDYYTRILEREDSARFRRLSFIRKYLLPFLKPLRSPMYRPLNNGHSISANLNRDTHVEADLATK